MKIACALSALISLAACQQPTQTPPSTPTPEATPPAPTSTADAPPALYFYFGNHVPRSLITAVEGADTARARLVGHTTPEDGREYCTGMMGPDASEADLAGCEAADSSDQTMTADCLARTVSDGSPAAWIRDDPADDGKVLPVWRDVVSGDIRDYSGAGGGYVLTAAFRILCPAASANIAPDPS